VSVKEVASANEFPDLQWNLTAADVSDSEYPIGWK
jgi:hypothetical protein